VESYLNVLSDPAMAEDREQYGTFIYRCKRRVSYMRKMINDLLDMTYIESGEKQRQLEELNVTELAKEAIDTNRESAAERNIHMELHAEEEVPMVADSGELQIVINNLITNAIKYNRDEGRVDVFISADDETVSIAVSDTGIGMTEEERGKLFQDFARIKNEKTKDILGSGLGLSTVKKIAQLYSGSVEVESVPEEGSTFTVLLRRRSQG
jgi:signal transduction histidine kinase